MSRFFKIIILIFILVIISTLTLVVNAQELMKSLNFKLEISHLEIQEGSTFQNISLVKKENGKEKITGQAEITDQYLISGIPENEFLNNFSYLSPGFKNLEVSIESDQPIFKKENFYHPLSFFEKTKTLFGYEVLPEYRLTKEIKSNSESIETGSNISSLEFKTSYIKKNQELNNNEGIKQSLILKNNSENKVNLQLTLKHTLETESVYIGGVEYFISETPQLLPSNTSTQLYFYSNGKKFTYDFSDGLNYNPEIWVFRKDNQNLLLVKFSFSLLSNASINIDPTYGVEIIILNVHSHPQAGDNWTVSFETAGTADLTITPNDQNSIDDLDFVSLTCDDQERIPQILEGDVIFYPNWSCEGTGEIVHLVNVARAHVLKFQFGDQIAYAYNSPDWYNSSWSYRTKITIDHTKVANDLTDFPALVSTTSSNLSSKAQSNGNDILFTQSDGTTKLNHEIESYTSSTGALVAWVKTNLSSTTDTVLYMYYGNSGASNQQNATSVWDSNYGGVWHLTEINAIDSTNNHNTGTASGSPTTTNGKIGNAVNFTGATRYIGFTTATSIDLKSQSLFTIEAWLYYVGAASGQVWMHQSQGASSWNIYSGTYALDPGHNNANMKFGHRDISSATRDPLDASVPTTGEWHSWVLTYNTTTPLKAIYLDGALVTSTATGEQTPLTTIRAGPTTATQIGYGGDYGAYNGYVDEFRLTKGLARSAAWISTSYNSQSSPLTFMTFGSEEAYNTAPTIGTVILNGGSNIILVENATTTVQATTTVSDTDGYSNITSVIGKIYRSGVGSSCSSDNNNCYSISSCATSSCAGNNCTATCSANLWFFADPTDAGTYSSQYWSAWIKAIDATNASSSATSAAVEVNTLYAFSLSTSTIDYGALAAGSNTVSLNKTTTITDTGNEAIDIYLYGTDFFGNNYPGSSASWYGSSWSYRKKITINHTKVADSLTDFPVLISTTSNDLSSKAQSNGNDILFTQSDGITKLNHEIESYTSSTGALVAWVKTNLSSTTDTVLYMYYGNSGASDQQNTTSVWDSNYAAVYHLRESGFTYYDSTAYHNNITAGVIPTRSTGGIGYWQLFDGTSNYLTIPAGAGLTGAFTLEAIVKAQSTSTSEVVFGYNRTDYSNSPGLSLGFSLASNAIFIGHAGLQKSLSPASLYMATGTTYWWSNAHPSTSTITFYINGADQTANYGDTTYFNNSSTYYTIGARNYGGYGLFWNGYIDEVRISSTTRSAAWISTSYNSQNSPLTFMTFGSEENQQYVINVSNQEYGTTGLSYGSGTDLTGISTTSVEVDLSKPTSYPSTSTDDLFFGLGIPVSQALDTYNGTGTIEAKSD